jgi:hypothetical protein
VLRTQRYSPALTRGLQTYFAVLRQTTRVAPALLLVPEQRALPRVKNDTSLTVNDELLTWEWAGWSQPPGSEVGEITARRAAIDAKREIYTAQIRAVYQHIPMVLAVNIVNSALVALVLASYMEQTRWWVFFGSVVALTGMRAAGWRRYRRDPKPLKTPPSGRYSQRQDRGSQVYFGALPVHCCFPTISLN